MAKKAKDSFIVFYEWEENLEKLSDQQMGQVFRAIFAYEKRGERYNGPDFAVDMAMNFIYGVIDRNREKYDAICERNRRNGIKGGAPTGNHNATKQPKQPSGLSGLKKQPKQPDHENDPDHDLDHDPDPDREQKKEDRFFFVFSFFRERISDEIPPHIEGQIKEYCLDMGEETVLDAMEIACNSGKKSWGYVKGILENWKNGASGTETTEPEAPPEKNKADKAETCSIFKSMYQNAVRDVSPPPGCCGAYIFEKNQIKVQCIRPGVECVFKEKCNI